MADEIEQAPTIKQPLQQTPRGRFPWQGLAMVMIALAVVAGLGVGFYFYEQMARDQDRLAIQVQQANHALDQLTHDFSDVKASASASQSATDTMLTEFKTIKQSVAELAAAQSANKEKWVLTEAYYFARLANDQLRFSNNVPNAIYLLQMADQDIQKLHNPKWDSIRAAITNDLATLKNSPVVDVPGLYLQLNVINRNIVQLPLFNHRGSNVDMQDAGQAAALPWWQRAWQSFKMSIQKIVTVRYNEAGQLPLITPDVQMYLYQNIQSQLEQASFALLHNQPLIYHASLQQAIDWIKQYVVMDASLTQVVLKQLDELNKIDISPALPNLLSAVTAFEAPNLIER